MPGPQGARCGSKTSTGESASTAIQFAIRLSGYECFSYTFVPSLALHVVEFTFSRGFDSFRAHHLFQQLAGRYRRKTTCRVRTVSVSVKNAWPSRNKLIPQERIWKLIAAGVSLGGKHHSTGFGGLQRQQSPEGFVGCGLSIQPGKGRQKPALPSSQNTIEVALEFDAVPVDRQRFSKPVHYANGSRFSPRKYDWRTRTALPVNHWRHFDRVTGNPQKLGRKAAWHWLRIAATMPTCLY